MQDELTLKELILAIQDYFRYFLRKWYWLALGGLIVGSLFFYSAFTEPVTFSAPLTFMMNNEKESSIGAGAILGSLGLGGGGGEANSAMTLLEMAQSRQLLGKVLFDSARVEDKGDLIANHLIQLYDYHKQWEESEQLNSFLFRNGMPLPTDRVENSVFKQLYALLIRKDEGLFTASIDENSGVFSLQTTTVHPELSIAITERVYRELKSHYIQATTSGKKLTLEQLRLRADSVQTELNLAEGRLARFQDRSGTITLRSNTAEGTRLNREVMILSTMYAEIVKNRETSAFLLAIEKPVFNIIDGPLEPLFPIKKSVLFWLVMGFFIGIVAVLLFLYFSKLVNNAIKT